MKSYYETNEINEKKGAPEPSGGGYFVYFVVAVGTT